MLFDWKTFEILTANNQEAFICSNNTKKDIVLLVIYLVQSFVQTAGVDQF